MDEFTRGSLRFNVLDFGPTSGEVIVALHGFPENAGTWESVANKLSGNGYRVLAFDQRGYSPSARPKGAFAYRLSELVEDVEALIAASKAASVHLVGHDWGGVVAWALAANNSARVRSLTAVSTPHPRAFAQTFVTSKQALDSWYMLLFLLPFAPRLLLSSLDGRILRDFLVRSSLPEAAARDYAERFVQDPALATAAANWYRALPFDLGYGIKISAVSAKTLYVLGAEDPFVSKAAAAATSRWVTGEYRFELLDGASHWIPEENSESLASLITCHIRTSAENS